MKAKNNKNFTYQGYSVPKSFILKLKYKKRLIAHDIDRIIFWAVQYCKYKNGDVTLIQAIQSGIKKGWIFKLINSDFESKEYVQAWIDKEIYHRSVKKEDRQGYCKVCKGTRKDWKTKLPCKACSSGREMPKAIGDILKEVL